MIEINPLWVIVLVEVVCLLSLICGVMLWLRLRARLRDRRAAKDLVGSIKENETQHLEETRTLLQTKYQYAGQALEQSLADIVSNERQLCQAVIDLYLKRDADALRHLDNKLNGLTSVFRALEVPVSDNVNIVASNEVDITELEKLRDENERLRNEQRATKDTMGRMLTEYSTMFGGDMETPADKEKIMAMFNGDEAQQGSVAEDAGTAVVARSSDPELDSASTEDKVPEVELDPDFSAEPTDELLRDVQQQMTDPEVDPLMSPEELGQEGFAELDPLDETQVTVRKEIG